MNKHSILQRFTSAVPLALIVLLTAGAGGQNRYGHILDTPQGSLALERLAEMEQSGSITGIGELIGHPDPLIRIRCAEVLGRVDHPSGTGHYLSKLCEDEHIDVVQSAIFAMGLTGEADAVEILARHLKDAPRYIKIRALIALGHTKRPEAADLIIPYLKNFHYSLRAEAALALAALGDSSVAPQITSSLHDPNPHVVASAAYALGRLGFPAANDRLISLLDNPNPEVKLRVAEALGRLEEKRAADPLYSLIANSDRMVAIKAAEALGRIGDRISIESLEKALSKNDSYMKTVSLKGIAAAGDRKSFDSVAQLLEDTSQMVRIAAIEAAASTGGERARDYLLDFLKNGNDIEKMAAAEFLGEIGNRDDLVLLSRILAGDGNVLVREGAAAGLGRWEHHEHLTEQVGGGLEKYKPVKVLLEAADGDDWVVAAIAIEALGNTVPRIALSGLAGIFSRHGGRVDGDRKLAILGAVANIDPKELEEAERGKIVKLLREGTADPDPRVSKKAVEVGAKFGMGLARDRESANRWKRGMLPWGKPATPLGERRIKIETDRGDIEILLFGDDAPNMVKSILTLAREGFYEGLSFHRVVPGFVIQGGCPRGDGWGDAGYFLRSEFNMHRYGKGTVGMAHAGKDTPGSQFFITHSPQPHLDGRYTVIGRVTSGMDVVSRIEAGDKFNIIVLDE